MKKRILVVAALATALVLGVGGYIFAAGPMGQSSTETAIAVVGENVEMAVRSPLEVVTKWTGTSINWQEGQITSVYPGQVIGEGEITITNVSPIPQAAYLTAKPISVDGDVWSMFEVVAKSADTAFYPWQPIVLQPGATIDLRIEVKVTYGSPISSPFKGVELIVRAAAPPTPPGLG